MNLRNAFSLVSACALMTAAAATAHAGAISGTAYCNIASPNGPTQQGSQYATNGVTLGTLSAAEQSGSLCSTFSSNTISYDAGYNNSISTLKGFLTSTAGNTTFSQAPAANQSALGTLLVLTGSTYLVNGQQYTLTHDDGANLYIGTGAPMTLLVAQGGQTVANQQPFTFDGTTGQYNFELLYVSNYQAPSELVSNLVATPEPSSLVLLGTGLVGVGGAIRRRFLR